MAAPIIPSSLTVLGYTLPTVIWGVLGLYAAVFALWRMGSRSPHIMAFLGRHFVMDPFNLGQGRWYTIVTSALSHTSIFHVAFNAFILISIAPELLAPVAGLDNNAVMTQLEFAAFYAAAAAMSSLAQFALARTRWLGGTARAGIGASGVLFALFAVHATVLPASEFIFFPIPYAFQGATMLWLLPTVDAAGILWNALNPHRATPIGNIAHLVGLLVGLAYVYAVTKPRMEENQSKARERQLGSRRWD
ncbi:hypothetical protein P8C59_009382 [Phyllachora maydis]|uniref:Peptidase S54 rhomboid domain-containing protein n=1 Tax=Phyllachora maydis TaxID=1825666 RepID=A0AAD9ID12_9PEZI|nr:hypothetical protein P8C59_009382 [Phyllachora maydis]